MRAEKWFIRDLDESQKKVIDATIDSNIIVEGHAGSGKTNLAIHRAAKVNGQGSFLFLVLTISLKRMIAYGLKQFGLDESNITYEWAWNNRGIDLIGDVYGEESSNKTLYLYNNGEVRKFVKIEENEDNKTNNIIYSLDLVDRDINSYKKYGQPRTINLKEVFDFDSNEFSLASDKFDIIPAAVLFKRKQYCKFDYLIVDEAQDFKYEDYIYSLSINEFKGVSLFGDPKQTLNSTYDNFTNISRGFNLNNYQLGYNYRIPKTIAKFAQKIHNISDNIIDSSRKDNGNTDYPNYPKPQLIQFENREKELDWIINKVNTEALDDVAILVSSSEELRFVQHYLEINGIGTQVLYRTNNGKPPFRTINTLDFTNNSTISILEYFQSKGSEFENIFIPFLNEETIINPSPQRLYVACTRSSRNLYMTYSKNAQKVSIQKPVLLLPGLEEEPIIEPETENGSLCNIIKNIVDNNSGLVDFFDLSNNNK